MTVVTREQWAAAHEDGYGTGDAVRPATTVWLHHTVTIAPDIDWSDMDGDDVDDDEAEAVRTVERIGEQRFGRGVSYNRLIAPRGVVYAGVSWGNRGAHTRGYNRTGRGYALLGDYDRHPVTDAQIEAIAADLVQAWRDGEVVDPQITGPHSQVASTACPGRYGRAAIPRINALARWLQAGASPETPSSWTPEDSVSLLVVHPNGAARLRVETATGAISLPVTSNRTRKRLVKTGAVEYLCDTPEQFHAALRNIDEGDRAEFPVSNR